MNLKDGLRSRRGNTTRSCSPKSISAPIYVQDEPWKNDKQQEIRYAVRSEIATAVGESLSKSRASGRTNLQALRVLELEASKMLESVDSAEARNEMSKAHNTRMLRRANVLFLAGFACLVCPVLMLFNVLTFFLPHGYVETLGFAAQQDSAFGSMSRFCLHTVATAKAVQIANDENAGAYLWGCLGAMMLILLLVRRTTRRQRVLTAGQLEQVMSVRECIQEELAMQRVQLKKGRPTSRNCQSSLCSAIGSGAEPQRTRNAGC